MPSRDVGGALLSSSALNCRPNSRSCTHRPSAVSHSPALTAGTGPTTVTGSRLPRTWTLSTAKPFSSLKKVTRSTRPERLSGGDEGGVCNQREILPLCPLPSDQKAIKKKWRPRRQAASL